MMSAKAKSMKYHLLSQALHSEICLLLPIYLAHIKRKEEEYAEASRRGGWMVAYSNTIPLAEQFISSIQSLSILGLNKFGLPCSPSHSECNEIRLLLPANLLKYVQQLLETVNQAGIGEELSECPWLEVPDRFRFGAQRDNYEYEVEHWNEAAALDALRNCSWVKEDLYWKGTSGGYAIGGIATLPAFQYESEEPSEESIAEEELVQTNSLFDPDAEIPF